MTGLGAMMAGGNPAEGREDDDFYSTPKEATRALMQVLQPIHTMQVWEPCCGEGAMSDTIASYGAKVLASDINPRGVGQTQDFFAMTELPAGIQAIITNPPWSRAEEFIRHAWETLKVDQMALLLKATYWHAATRLPLFRECTPAVIMPLTWRLDFKGLGRPTMECSWFLWDRKFPVGQMPSYMPLMKPGPSEVVPVT